MYRSAVRSTPRALSAARQSAIRTAPRRFASTTPADKPRSWKGSALRWGLAAGAVYWYNTSPVFAEEPLPRTIPAPSQFSDSDLTTVDAIVEEKRKRAIAKAEEAKPAPAAAPVPTESSEKTQEALEGEPAPGSPEALEAEADQQGAFNPETGEINWDCPCLGGMADGPCGEEFKAAFSCFVYSKEEPKGMDCIEKFQGMQTCFRKYPEVYGAELADDDEYQEGAEDARPALDANTDATVAPPATSANEKKETKAEIKGVSEEKKPAAKSDAEKQDEEVKQMPKPEPVDLSQPNSPATDATAANNNI
ncbi:CHCH domain-containing protein [Colletotrichum graminicola M1.001]|uniref:Mitochondrial intermembrane space import and assembly protein 40 n=1 Tax=Colletotrichum graminicola (strain M1.001 / M2 / FGSC 10212) TaxID=645133 RepID=E3QSC0_COLGM|nr:CHCH domain-containing protein [Colletotrichum graminicola M1.001]EFQ33747.1 CHCH domain-containing protein [Colletotrichum graminicola M1.001]